MKKLLFLLVAAAIFALPHKAEAQMTIVKYVPKKVYVEPEFDYFEHMLVDVVNDQVVKVVYQGKVTENQNENFAKALHRWEQEAWEVKNFTVVVDQMWASREKYLLVRSVYKPQPKGDEKK